MNRGLVGAIASVTIAGCGLSLTVALLSVRLDAMGFSARAIGINTAAAGVATLFCAPMIPRAARAIGVARCQFLALLLGGVALLGFTITSSYAAWLVLRFAVSGVVTVLFVLSEYWISTAAAGENRGLAIGLYATSLGAGFACGPMLLALVGTGGDMPFIAGAILFWSAAIPLAFASQGAPLLVDASRKPLWRFLKEAPEATAAALLHGAIEVAGISLLPVYALRTGASLAQGALLASLFVLGNSALQVPLGLLSDRVDRRRLLLGLAGLGLGGALLLAGMGTASSLAFQILLLLWGGTVGGFYPVGLAELASRYRDGDLAGATAAFVMTYALGMLIGPPFVGAGLDLVSPNGFFLAIGLLIGAYILATVFALRRAASVAAAHPRGPRLDTPTLPPMVRVGAGSRPRKARLFYWMRRRTRPRI